MTREKKYYMTVLMNIKYYECCGDKRVLMLQVVKLSTFIRSEFHTPGPRVHTLYLSGSIHWESGNSGIL